MAKLKFIQTDRANLSEYGIVGGQIIHCTDTDEFFFDNANTVRIMTQMIELVDSIKEVTDPVTQRVYIDRHAYIDEFGIFRYQPPELATMYIITDSGVWQEVRDSIEVSSFLTSYTEMEPAILQENGKNKAPATLAKYVFTENGSNVQDILNHYKSMMGDLVSVEITQDNQNTFDVVLPSDNYFNSSSNLALVIVNGSILPSSKYSFVRNSKLVLSTPVSPTDTLSILFMYQVAAGDIDGVSLAYSDGGYLLNRSVDTNKLAKVTNSYMVDDNNVVATAKAVYDSHRTLMQKINTIDPTGQVYTVEDDSSNNYEIVLYIKKYALSDCNTITFRTKYDIGTDAEVYINNLNPVPLYTSIDQPIKEGIVKAGQVITIRYSAQDERFYIINPDLYSVVKDLTEYYVDGVNISGPVASVPITFTNYNPVVDVIDVYYENIRLFKDLNYTVTGNSITFKGFCIQNGERVIMERTRVVASNL